MSLGLGRGDFGLSGGARPRSRRTLTEEQRAEVRPKDASPLSVPPHPHCTIQL